MNISPLPILNTGARHDVQADWESYFLPNRGNHPGSIHPVSSTAYQPELEALPRSLPHRFGVDEPPNLSRISARMEASIQSDPLGADLLLGQANQESILGNLAEDTVSRSPLSAKTSQSSLSDAMITPSSRTIGDRSKTVAAFDVSANLKRENTFYDLPYPFDGRLNRAGSPNLSGFPIFKLSLVANTLKNKAEERSGFPVNTPGYFRFNAPLAPQDSDQVIKGRPRSPIWLLDIDPGSPDRGKLLPTVASTLSADAYVPDHLLAVAPAPGIILRPDTTYAYVVKRSLRDSEGKRLGIPSDFKQLRKGNTPDGDLGQKTHSLFRPFWKTLDTLDVSRKAIAVATVFTTGDVVADLEDLSDQVLDRYDLSIDDLTLEDGSEQSSPRFYQLNGTIDLPQFQNGTPPFDLFGGQFKFDAKGDLIEQRVETDVPIVLTLPKTPMPDGGYPLVVYYHGSNGLHTQVIDRGPILEPGGEPTSGLGPAHVLAEQGFATLGMALPLNPERLPGGADSAYLNPLNLTAYPDTFQQGVLEQRLILEAIAHLKITPEIFGDIDVADDLGFHSSYRINSDAFFAMGQSHGAQYATMVSAVEPKIRAVVPTGSGGFWSLLATESDFNPLISLLLGTAQKLNFLHPALALLQTAWEPADPIIYMPRLARRPLLGHPARSIYQPVGLADPEFSESIFDAVALATGVQQVGNELWPEMQESLSLEGLDGIQEYSVAKNLRSENGRRYTGVVVQYAGDGLTNSHNIFAQLDAVKIQYAHFFKSFYERRRAVVIDPENSSK